MIMMVAVMMVQVLTMHGDDNDEFVIMMPLLFVPL